jgi:hypothetical protein|nr:discoidin domain-containing protein [Bacteroides intestinalis]
MKRRLFVYLLFVSILTSCYNSAKVTFPVLEDVLNDNPALKTVLEKYQSDSLKYQAAVFLIENLPFHYSYEGDALNDYYKLYELHGKGTMYPEAVLDSVLSAYGSFRLNELKRISDINIDPDYLIENIEWAFKVWQEQPWGKNVSFSNFCEFILPYRVGDEKLESWREKIYNQYNPLLDSIRGLPEVEDPLFVSQFLMEKLQRGPVYFTGLFDFGPFYGPKVVEWRSGSCMDFTYLQLYVFRALGLPCSEELMLMRGNGNVAHYWNAVFDKQGNSYYCSILDPTPELKHPDAMWDPKGKVYRRTFSINKETVSRMNKSTEDVYPTFRQPCFDDVTSIYAGKKNHVIKIGTDDLYCTMKKGELVYLCIASHMNWEPIGWCLYNQGCRFSDVEGDVVFRLATYEKGRLIMQSDPFLLERDSGNIRFFSSEGKNVNVTLTHKYELYFEPFVRHMLNGVFEGSNVSDFSIKDTLHIIREFPERLWNVATVDSEKSYKYARYYGPEDGYCDISEISFFESHIDSVPLSGSVLCPSECKDSGEHPCLNAFDGNPYSSFHYSKPTGGWVALEFNSPRRISRIVFTPRNRDNFIRLDDEYELFYCDKGEWKSAGKTYPQSDSLLYEVPDGSLLYLKNHTRGMDERIFEYQNGKQRFW